MLEAAKAAGEEAGEHAQQQLAEQLELVPSKERKRFEREALEARRRSERRARTLLSGRRCASPSCGCATCCACARARGAVHAPDRRAELAEDARGRDAESLREAIELVQDTRLRMQVNVSEELALEALAYRLQALLAPVAVG